MSSNPISESNQFEFNDSVLATQAWNSSRYDGRQLQASAINEASSTDIGNNDKNPIIQKYTRNIYLGSKIIGMGNSLPIEREDPTLMNFPGFSYITVHEYITVNDDGSVSRHSVTGDKVGGDNRIKKGWYQAWYDDFPINSGVSLRFFDESLETNIASKYEIFFNGGQLKKLLHVREFDTGSRHDAGAQFIAQYQTGSHSDQATSNTVGSGQGSLHRFHVKANNNTTTANTMSGSFTIFNEETIINKFFSGSLISSPYIAPPTIPDTEVDEGPTIFGEEEDNNDGDGTGGGTSIFGSA
tara:strand:- start:28 stop:921 length:894 start_codon:yes stop_codon:yes gene_type:complete